jgi:CRISPR-associated endonuclease/helicase Cas3
MKRDKAFFETIILNSDLYFAHIDPANTQRKEFLTEHANLVISYFYDVCSRNNLEEIISKLISAILPNKFSNKIRIKEFIKQLFIDSIAYHDFGKVNHLFQWDKMGNYNPNLIKVNHHIQSRHSIISAYIFLQHQYEFVRKLKLNDSEQSFMDWIILCFAYPILKHHSSTIDDLREDIKSLSESLELKDYLSFFSIEISDDHIDEIHNYVLTKIDGLLVQLDNELLDLREIEFPLYALIKLCSSLLTTSDYLATTHFMNGWSKMFDEYGIFSNQQKEKIVSNIKTTQIYNKNVYNNLVNFELLCPQEKSNENLNRLRSEMSVEVIRNIRSNANKRLFYIEAPTGGGKTNLSMIALAELLKHDIDISENNINKVFYVFPFTTLITQTYETLKKTFGLDESEMIELHSKAGFKTNGGEDEYGENQKTYLDALFINYPVIVTSHVKFFDILTTNKKDINYMLHRIANSVVIIDELQSYSPEQWDKLIYLIDNYAEYFNIKFILMSATLPKIGKLTWAENIPDFVYLIQDKEKFFQNENFKGRVQFDFSLLSLAKPKSKEEKKEVYLPQLCNKLYEESSKYYYNTGRAYTIIEFIFKHTASEFYKIAYEMNNNFFDHIFVLSGTILEPRRKEIIEFLKDKNNKDKKILLITTQVVEAGVDIDMDLGFKDKSLVDSDEQLAGRINRNVNKDKCTLFIFDCDNASFIYGNDSRYNILKSSTQEEYEQILRDKTFDTVYNKVIENRKKHNEGAMNMGLSDFQLAIRNLKFPEVNRSFTLIDNQNYSVFVQVDIPVFIPHTDKCNFSENELSFLKEFGKYNAAEKNVSGEMVWTLYTEIIQLKNEDFVEQKLRMKKIQSIMSKFVFSIFAHSKDVQHLIERGYKEHDFGFIRLHDIIDNDDAVYNYEYGLVDEKLEEALIF